MADQQKGANQDSEPTNTVMIDTTDTPKRQPLLKLGKKRFGANRGAEEESKAMPEMKKECVFKECGRKFVSSEELRNHMTRRHMPAQTPDEPAKGKVVAKAPVETDISTASATTS